MLGDLVSACSATIKGSPKLIILDETILTYVKRLNDAGLDHTGHL